jgi:hypothetical protein
MVLFFLTIILAGMTLSQLIEEKSNKVIEVLAAAIPIESIFLGKLFAMLAASVVGIVVWVSVGIAAFSLLLTWRNGGASDARRRLVAVPGLGVIYFAMNYLLLGSVFLSIGAQASTAREVQTLSMPVTVAQVLIFGFRGFRRRNAGFGYRDRRGGLPLVLAAGDAGAGGRAAGAVDPCARDWLAGAVGRADRGGLGAAVPPDGAQVGAGAPAGGGGRGGELAGSQGLDDAPSSPVALRQRGRPRLAISSRLLHLLWLTPSKYPARPRPSSRPHCSRRRHGGFRR